MKSLNQVLEMRFQTKDFYKHNYLNDVIDKLCNGDSIRLGNNGEEIFDIDKKIQNNLKSEFNQVRDIDDFNDVCKKYGIPTWSKIFKGDFSGYTDGLASKNKGNLFEIMFIRDFNEYLDDFTKSTGISKSDLTNFHLEHAGTSNTRRPITITKSKIFLGKDPKNVGDDVADVKLVTNKGNYNLSLKNGGKVTFCNAGISKFIKPTSFQEYKDSGMYYPGTEQGQLLLDMFGIDNNKFADVFVNYKGYGGGRKLKSTNENIDVTEYAKKPLFMDFIKSVIGCNYILVHQDNKHNVHFYDLRTEKDLEKFIGNVTSMDIHYPNDGNKKSLEIILETSTLKVIFNFRNKNSGVIPYQLMVDYIIK